MSGADFVLAAFVLLGIVAFVVVAIGTVIKAPWGVNFRSVHCPKCNALLPMTRKPRTKQQAMWGGWTCGSCGCEVDKWGRELQPEDVIFLDDIGGNLKTARSLGMRTIRVILGKTDDAVRELERATGLKLLERDGARPRL